MKTTWKKNKSTGKLYGSEYVEDKRLLIDEMEFKGNFNYADFETNITEIMVQGAEEINYLSIYAYECLTHLYLK